ncbi:UNKNOWN [Stylonychia lemnae]|uniref:Uncharacterized protein n=1 Tax=Stylonychia lemnae TaxID=5949 RepID=A0A078AVS4_STYLE|nr:UNKNOWN [Stylonychia lemnae]|eukprot:CDW86520.1 UNKNOWN [Stylonychia lemnae]
MDSIEQFDKELGKDKKVLTNQNSVRRIKPIQVFVDANQLSLTKKIKYNSHISQASLPSYKLQQDNYSTVNYESIPIQQFEPRVMKKRQQIQVVSPNFLSFTEINFNEMKYPVFSHTPSRSNVLLAKKQKFNQKTNDMHISKDPAFTSFETQNKLNIKYKIPQIKIKGFDIQKKEKRQSLSNYCLPKLRQRQLNNESSKQISPPPKIALHRPLLSISVSQNQIYLDRKVTTIHNETEKNSRQNTNKYESRKKIKLKSKKSKQQKQQEQVLTYKSNHMKLVDLFNDDEQPIQEEQAIEEPQMLEILDFGNANIVKPQPIWLQQQVKNQRQSQIESGQYRYSRGNTYEMGRWQQLNFLDYGQLY